MILSLDISFMLLARHGFTMLSFFLFFWFLLVSIGFYCYLTPLCLSTHSPDGYYLFLSYFFSFDSQCFFHVFHICIIIIFVHVEESYDALHFHGRVEMFPSI